MSIFSPHKPQYTPHSTTPQTTTSPADTIYPKAYNAYLNGNPEQALEYLNGFSNNYPNHPDLSRSYCLAATIMHEHYGQTDNALALLDQLTHHANADHELIAQTKKKITE